MRTSNEQQQQHMRANVVDTKPVIDDIAAAAAAAVAGGNVPPPYPGSKNINADKASKDLTSFIDAKEFIQMSPSDDQNELGKL